jgi:hypothetical protein
MIAATTTITGEGICRSWSERGSGRGGRRRERADEEGVSLFDLSYLSGLGLDK